MDGQSSSSVSGSESPLSGIESASTQSPSTTTSESPDPRQQKRLEQNGAWQRAFQQRKEKHAQDLEFEIAATEAAQDQLMLENARLQQELQQAAIENTVLQGFIPPPGSNKGAQSTMTPTASQYTINNPDQAARYTAQSATGFPAIQPSPAARRTRDTNVAFRGTNIWRGAAGRGMIQGAMANPNMLSRSAAARVSAEQRTKMKKRKVSVRVACNTCRTKKAACDGNRPRCGRCTETDNKCVYVSTNAEETPTEVLKRQVGSLKQQLKNYEDFLDGLMLLPERDVVKFVRGLQASTDPSRVIHHLLGGLDATNRPSEFKTARAISPWTDSSLEFELMARHRLIYPKLTPMGANFAKYRKSHESPFEKSSSSRFASAESSSMVKQSWANWPLANANPPFREGEDDRGQALPTGKYCDDRLCHLQIQYWTRVSISDKYAAAVLSSYFKKDHPILGTFDVDSFLEDLIAHRERFCSPFLLNSLMYTACLSYTAFDSRASTLKFLFFDEAQRYWSRERHSPTIVNLAAITTLCVGCLCHGKEKFGNLLMAEARQMAEQLGFLGVDPLIIAAKIAAFQQMPSEWIQAASHIAWGTYGWLWYHGLFYQDEPIRHPPSLPIPGQSTTKSDARWPMHRLPAYMGCTFPSLCEFWTLSQDIWVAYSDAKVAHYPTEEALAIAESKYQKLLSWTDMLPLDMARSSNCPAHVLVFHVFYHCLVLRIFRPFVVAGDDQSTVQARKLMFFSSLDSSPDTIWRATLNQLKHILFDKYFLYPKYSHIIFYNVGIIQLANASLRDQSDPDWRVNFLFCVRCWQDLYISYPILGSVLHAYLSMALHKGLISTGEANRLSRELSQMDDYHDANEQAAMSMVNENDVSGYGTVPTALEQRAQLSTSIVRLAKIAKHR